MTYWLTTDLGAIDVLAEITGGGGYRDLLTSTITLRAFGRDVRGLGLAKLIAVKRAAGRPKAFD